MCVTTRRTAGLGVGTEEGGGGQGRRKAERELHGVGRALPREGCGADETARVSVACLRRRPRAGSAEAAGRPRGRRRTGVAGGIASVAAVVGAHWCSTTPPGHVWKSVGHLKAVWGCLYVTMMRSTR